MQHAIVHVPVASVIVEIIKMNTEALMDLVRFYYPKDQSYSDDFMVYCKTQEYERLEKAHVELMRQQPFWNERISELNSICNTRFYSLMPNHMDRCLSYQMKIGEEYRNIRITLDISGLGDYFSLRLLKKEVSNDIFKIKGTDLRAMREMRKLISYVFIDSFGEYVRQEVLSKIEEYLEKELGLVKLESGQLEQVVEGYEFDNRDDPFTFYSALFTSDPMIQ